LACAGSSATTPGPASPSATAPAAASGATASGAAPAAADASAAAPAHSAYDKPSRAVLDVLHAAVPPTASVSPTNDAMILYSWVQYPPISRVAEPFLRLAGVRVEPKNRAVHGTRGNYGITPCAAGYRLSKIPSGAEVHVALPEGACAGSPYWSADGKHFAFRNLGADAVELWLGDAATGEVHRVPSVRLNPMLGSFYTWMPDQKRLLVKLVPKDQGAPPAEQAAPSGPSVQDAAGEKGQSSTYEANDVLKTPHDQDLFDYYAAAQLAYVDAATGAVTPIGAAGLYADVTPSPDGEHLLVETIHKPYSYLTTVNRFPRNVDVWDASGKALHSVASIPLADRVPVHGVRTGPRDFAWRATDPATLVWAEALDGGDWNAKVPQRDKVMLQKAPFSAAPVEITRTEQRFGGVSWGERPNLALLHEYDDNRHWTRTFTLDVDDAKAKPQLLWDLSADEHYKDPGEPAERQLPNGSWVTIQDGDSIYLAGEGSSPEGDRPFLDRLNLKTRQTERLFRSDKNAFERFW
ncbi:MAG TPA: hypothetical protein VGI39_32430, partial [Polyangiaceae bacterium]